MGFFKNCHGILSLSNAENPVTTLQVLATLSESDDNISVSLAMSDWITCVDSMHNNSGVCFVVITCRQFLDTCGFNKIFFVLSSDRGRDLQFSPYFVRFAVL